MGATLEKIYQVVTQKTGFKGRMKLAETTGVSRTKAAQIEEDPEIINRFKKAADEIIGQDIDEFLG